MSEMENSHLLELDNLLDKIKHEHDAKEFTTFFITSILSIFLLFAIFYIAGLLVMHHDNDNSDFIGLLVILILGGIPLWALINYLVFQIQKRFNPVTKKLHRQLTELKNIKVQFVEGQITEIELAQILAHYHYRD